MISLSSKDAVQAETLNDTLRLDRPLVRRARPRRGFAGLLPRPQDRPEPVRSEPTRPPR